MRSRPEDGGTLHVDAAAILPFAEALFASLLRGGYRNISRDRASPDRNFVQGHADRSGVPVGRASNAIYSPPGGGRAARGVGRGRDGGLLSPTAQAPILSLDPGLSAVPEGADFPFDHAGEGGRR